MILICLVIAFRLLEHVVNEPVCDDEEHLKKGNNPRNDIQTVEGSNSETTAKISRTSEEYSSSESEVCQAAHGDDQLAKGEESTDFREDRVVKLENPLDQPIEITNNTKVGDIKEEGDLKPEKESDSEVSLTDSHEFTDVLDDFTASTASNDLKQVTRQSEENEAVGRKGRPESKQGNVEVETTVIEVPSEAPSSDSGEFADVSEPPTPMQSVETLLKTPTFLGPEVEDDLTIDDDTLRAELEKLERQAQETTTSCVAEAQVKPFTPFIHPSINFIYLF